MSEMYDDEITRLSYEMLVRLNRDYRFVLIGGWAAYLYNSAGKSKDIDIVVDYTMFGMLNANFDVKPSSHLDKFEIKFNKFDVDIYVEYKTESLSIPPEFVVTHTSDVSGFTLADIDILLALKLGAYYDRWDKEKGIKDKIDINGLLSNGANISRMKNLIVVSGTKHEHEILGGLSLFEKSCTENERKRFFGNR